MALALYCDHCGQRAPESMRPRDLHQTRQIRIPERWIRLFGGEGADPAIELEVDVVFCGWKCFRDWAWKFGGERIVAEAQPS